MPKTPAAFLSYVQLNDKHDNGRLTQLRERLEYEVEVNTGYPFPIFQDRNDIRWGQEWEKRIEECIDAATFLIAIITPSYLISSACRGEFELFLKREKKLKRNDLILPLLYVDTPSLSDPKKLAADNIAKEIAKRHWADWRDLRHDPWTTPEVGKRLTKIAIQIREALERDTKSKLKRVKHSQRKASVPLELGNFVVLPDLIIEKAEVETRAFELGPSGQTDAKIITVDSVPGRADYQTITDAIRKATGGERILVRPGIYNEGIFLDKPLEILGDGPRAEIIVQSNTTHTLWATTEFGRVANLTLKQTGSKHWRCVMITQGRLQLEECEIMSQDVASIGVEGGADPQIRRCAIHGSTRCGIYVYKDAKGTFEDNDIYDHPAMGVDIRSGGDPVFRRNRIHDCQLAGVSVQESGKGTLEENDLFANDFGLVIRKGGDPGVRRNRIHDNKNSGIACIDEGAGTLEDNEVFVNGEFGITIAVGSDPTLRRNRIYACKHIGVAVVTGAKGTLEDNFIFANRWGIVVLSNGSPVVRRNHINRNVNHGVYVDGGGGVFEGNDLRDNSRGPWRTKPGSKDKSVRIGNVEK